MNTKPMTNTIRKYGWIAVGVYAFYAAFLMIFSPETYPLMPFGIIFGSIFVLLVMYLLFLINGEKKGKNSSGLEFFHMLKKYRFLIEQLVSRDFKAKYKRSVLGVLWSFLNPILLMIVQYVVFSTLFERAGADSIPHYATYLLAGIILFNGFLDCAGQSMHAITGNASLITKVYVPKYIYPVSKVFSAAINTLLSMIPLLVVACINGVRPALSWLLIPPVLMLVLLFTVGMGFLLSAVLVFFRDIEFLWGVFTTLWMYATPIIYSVEMLKVKPVIYQLEMFNPMYYYVTLLRTVIIDGIAPNPINVLICLGWGVVMLVFGALVFKKTQDQFILYL